MAAGERSFGFQSKGAAGRGLMMNERLLVSRPYS
jgi:hypothetical protein